LFKDMKIFALLTTFDANTGKTKYRLMKIGLLFGSFNPVHVGHLIIANYFREFTDLEEVWFVVSPQSPFKQDTELASDRDRLEMVRLALEGSRGYRACDVEMSLPRPSYTYRTLEQLRRQYSQNDFALIMGGDNIVDFHKWKNYQWIVSEFEIYVYPRPGIDLSNVSGINFRLAHAPLLEISATFIRQAIASGHDVSFFLHSRVAQYIQERGLYKTKN
jgi:nicotinate-nucleotide adenylyltransferase